MAGLEHLVIGSTGVWVIQSCQHGQPPPRHTATSPWQARGATADPLPKLRWQAAVFAEVLAGGVAAVRPLLCVPRRPAGRPVGRGRHGGDHAAPRRCHPSGSAAAGQ
jgi:hypothetical protein